jgi:hypothetical protein
VAGTPDTVSWFSSGTFPYDGAMSGAWVALVLALQAQPRIVVTAAGALDAQRLSDALHAYLGDVDIAVENAPAGDPRDIRQRMAEAKQLGESVRALAVIHAEGGSADAIEIELDDLTTQKTLIATVPKPPRDEDLYRTLALKIQSLLRATLSEARDTLDPASPAGRLAAESEVSVSPAPAPPPQWENPLAGRLALETGYQVLSLAAAGVVLQGMSVVASWKIGRRFDVALGIAVLDPRNVPAGDVSVAGDIKPIFGAARAHWRWRRVEVLVGPSLEVALASITPPPVTPKMTVTIRSSRDMILAAGAEGEVRLSLTGPLALYARGDVLGVLDAPAYEVGGASILDTSRLHVAGSVGVGMVFP